MSIRQFTAAFTFLVITVFAPTLEGVPLTLGEAQAKLESLDPETASNPLKKAWNDTVEALKLAAEYKDATARELAALESAPTTLAELEEQLSSPAVPPAGPAPGSDRSALEKGISDIDAQLARARSSLEAITRREDDNFTRQREIPELLSKLRNESAEAEIDNPARPLVTAPEIDKAVFELNLARRAALSARILALESEQRASPSGSDVLAARKRLASRTIKSINEKRNLWEGPLAEIRARETDADSTDARSLAEYFKDVPLLKELADEAASLAALRAETSAASAATETLLTEMTTGLEVLHEQRTSAKRRIQLLESAQFHIDAETGRLLRLQRSKLPTLSLLTSSLRQNLRKATEAQVDRLRIKDDYALLPADLEAAARDALSEAEGFSLAPEQNSPPRQAAETQVDRLRSEDDLTQLPADPEAAARDALSEAEVRSLTPEQISNLATRYRQLHEDLIRELGSYINLLSRTNQTNQMLIEDVRSYTRFIDQRLLWIPSAPDLSLSDFKTETLSYLNLASPAVFGNWVRNTARNIRQEPFVWLLFAGLIAFLLSRRKRHKETIKTTGAEGSRRACTYVQPTFNSLWASAMLALPLPLAFGFLALRANDPPQFGSAFRDCAFFFASIGFLKFLSLQNGVLQDHFRLPKERTAHLHFHVCWLFATLPILLFFTTLLLEKPLAPESGRLTFFVLMAVSGTFLHLVLRPSKGLIIQKNGKTWLAKLIHILGIAFPSAFVVGAAMGHITSVRTLREQTVTSAWIVLGGLFVAAVLTRCILISRRRLARDQAVQKFKAADAAKRNETDLPEKEGDKANASPARTLKEIEASAVDIVVVEEQTTRLLYVCTFVFVLIAVLNVWATSLPALSVLDRFTVWPLHQTTAANSAIAAPLVDLSASLTGQAAPPSADTAPAPKATPNDPHRISLLDLLASLSAIALTIVAARNLPGLLELTVLHRIKLGPGGNYAVSTVVRYIIVAAGIFCSLGVVGITWKSVQWLAAAVTLGIGFGLQEIFANFVAGIILLFERPMRLGDVVTIGDITGVVRKIEIRATTIQQFNNRELIVPNKDFITGQLVNWTLTDNRQRFEFIVGIAYGSDTELAEKTILDILSKHPKILKDPTPEVFFSAFGSSSLDFKVRAFIPEFSLFLRVQSELHFEIEKRFREAGIEIAFPQQDLHIRSVPDEWKLKSPGG